jgi:hypothetical protein
LGLPDRIFIENVGSIVSSLDLCFSDSAYGRYHSIQQDNSDNDGEGIGKAEEVIDAEEIAGAETVALIAKDYLAFVLNTCES